MNKEIIEQKNKNIISKHDLLSLANLDEKLNTTEMLLFLFGILHFDNAKKVSTFHLYEFEQFASIRFTKKNMIPSLQKLRKIGLLYFDEQFSKEESVKGLLKTVSLIEEIDYISGNFIITWNTKYADMIFGEGIFFTKLDLNVAKKLSDRGLVLYEFLKISLKSESRVFNLSISDLKRMYSLKNKVSNSYKYINQKYLQKAIEEINNNTELLVNTEIVKAGRKTEGVKIVVSKNLEFNGHLTTNQYQTLESMKAQLTQKIPKLNQEDIKQVEQLLALLSDIELLTSDQAGKIIALISKRIKYFNAKKSLSSVDHQLLEIENAIEEFDKLIDEQITLFWHGNPVTNQQKSLLKESLQNFQDKDDILEIAFKIAEDNKAISFNYIIEILETWLKEDITTAYKAWKHHEKNYGALEDKKEIALSDDFLQAMTLWSE